LKLLDQTLERFSQDLGEILGSGLYDVLIHGSCVLGDFRPHQGDIDYLALTNADLDEQSVGPSSRTCFT
jgi:hypothetical protein